MNFDLKFYKEKQLPSRGNNLAGEDFFSNKHAKGEKGTKIKTVLLSTIFTYLSESLIFTA